jgi:hypothetical protein
MIPSFLRRPSRVAARWLLLTAGPAILLMLNHCTHSELYYNFKGPHWRQNDSSAAVSMSPVGACVVKVEFDQAVSAGKPRAASAKIF